jgi:type II secretory pathway component PulF
MKWLRVAVFGFLVMVLVGVGILLTVIVPRITAGWAGYEVEVSAGIVWLIWMSDCVVQYPYIAFPFGIGVCVAAGYLLGVFGSSDRRSG